MKLKGKKIAFLGDSITEGYGASCEDQTYWRILGRETGAEVFGYGIGGTTVGKRKFPLEDPRPNMYFVSRVEGMLPDMDAVVVFGGTNDFSDGDSVLGTQDDRTVDTFFGAYHVLVQTLQKKYPNATILLMTPLHRTNEDAAIPMFAGAEHGRALVEYVDAVLDVAAYYHLPTVDLFRCCPIQPMLPEQREQYAPDGLHPNDAGHRLIADCLMKGFAEL